MRASGVVLDRTARMAIAEALCRDQWRRGDVDGPGAFPVLLVENPPIPVPTYIAAFDWCHLNRANSFSQATRWLGPTAVARLNRCRNSGLSHDGRTQWNSTREYGPDELAP